MKKRAVPPGFVVDRRDTSGVTLLMEAARRNMLDKVRECVEQGSNVNARDNIGWDPLMHAIHDKAAEAAQLLVHYGTDVTYATPKKMTALMLACQNGEMPEVVERLVSKGAPLDVQEEHAKTTALMMALSAHDGWGACRLLKAGADAETLKDTKGRTALDYARQYLRAGDLQAFEAGLDAQRAQRQAETAARAEQAAQTLAADVKDATVLKANIRPLKPVAFRPKRG